MNAAPAIDEAHGPELVGEDGRVVPLASASLRIEAGGGLARIVLEQTFENASDDVLRLTYKMPLPVDGAVSGYAFVIGDRKIIGRVDPKAQARQRFEKALAEGRTAALLEQEKADIFTQEIGNVPPRKTIVARITIDQRLTWLDEGAWELRFPTVIGLRYQDDVGIATSGEPLASRLDMTMRIADTLASGRSVESVSHAIEAEGNELRLRSRARLDRDVVVRWPVAKPEMGVSLACARPSIGATDLAYGLLTIVPPERARETAVPRDLIVLLDTSGSMGGTPLAHAKRIVRSLLASLGPKDRFEVVEFSSRPNAFHAGPLFATERDKKAAIAWVDGRSAGGGTEMHTAVLEALKSLRPDAQRQVVLVTDGYIGGEERIVALLSDDLPDACRMHMVGVGAAPNRALSSAIARAGRGVEVMAAIGEDLERATARLLAKTDAPVLTDVVLTGDALLAQAPEHVPDVFAGAPVLAGVQLRPEGGEIVVSGKLARGEWVQRVRVPAIAEGEGNAAIAALWARERVADLDVKWAMGRNAEGIDRAVERIGVDFQIATRLTSWIAVDAHRSVDPYTPSRTVSVPQELPYGTSLASFASPGAMPMPMQVFGAPAGMTAPMMMRPRLASSARAESQAAAGPAPLAQSMDLGRMAEPTLAPKKKRTRLFWLLALFVFLAVAAIVWFFAR
ncbi:MAG TPA: VIT domain-containing protein [Labilithrix sp.]